MIGSYDRFLYGLSGQGNRVESEFQGTCTRPLRCRWRGVHLGCEKRPRAFRVADGLGSADVTIGVQGASAALASGAAYVVLRERKSSAST